MAAGIAEAGDEADLGQRRAGESETSAKERAGAYRGSARRRAWADSFGGRGYCAERKQGDSRNLDASWVGGKHSGAASGLRKETCRLHRFEQGFQCVCGAHV